MVKFSSHLKTLVQTCDISSFSSYQGWTEGIPGMKIGGTRRLIIPADMAYGSNPPQGSGIPANADLVLMLN
jgi:FKBP-type peptidyl-prolyl cis-trans isomerase